MVGLSFEKIRTNKHFFEIDFTSVSSETSKTLNPACDDSFKN